MSSFCILYFFVEQKGKTIADHLEKKCGVWISPTSPRRMARDLYRIRSPWQDIKIGSIIIRIQSFCFCEFGVFDFMNSEMEIKCSSQ